MHTIIVLEIIGTILYFVVGLAGSLIWSVSEWTMIKEYKTLSSQEKISTNIFKIDIKVIVCVIAYLLVFAVLGNMLVTTEIKIALLLVLAIIVLLVIVMFAFFTFMKIRYTLKVNIY